MPGTSPPIRAANPDPTGVFGIADFAAVQETGNTWVFQGDVIGAAPGSVKVQLGGLPSLISLAPVVVNSDGSFEVTETLAANECGTATAQASDSDNNLSILATATVSSDGSSNGSSADAGPVLENPGTQNSSVGQYVVLNLKAWDNTTNIMSFSASPLPDGLNLDPADGVITGILAEDAATTGTPNSVTVTLTDNQGNQSQISFAWNVGPDTGANTVPTGVFDVVDFQAVRETGTTWVFEGRVIGAAPGQTTVQLGGLTSLNALAPIEVNADGTFEATETLAANEFGTATALATDSAYNQSNTATALVPIGANMVAGTILAATEAPFAGKARFVQEPGKQQTTAHNTSLVFSSTNANAIAISDTNTGDTILVTLHATNGTCCWPTPLA